MISDLTHELGVIEVSGVDSQRFLQGQLTNDINQLDEKLFQFSAHLNNKGRMLASFIITKVEPYRYYLITTLENLEMIILRLKMFVLRSKVIIGKYDCYILFGNEAISVGHVFPLIPYYFLSIASVASQGIAGENVLWKNTLINQGIPMIYKNTSEVFIPQHVNFDLLDGVNFKKGCYTGQEIVARTHYLGKVKRRMFKFITNIMPIIGHRVVSPKLDNQDVGVIVDVVKHDSNYLGLVAMQTDCVDLVFVDANNTHQLLVETIKY